MVAGTAESLLGTGAFENADSRCVSSIAPVKRVESEKPEALTTLKLKNLVENTPKDLEDRYGEGVASLAFGSRNETNVVAFDTGILVVPETKAVVFSSHALEKRQIKATHAFLAKPWSTWIAEAEKENSSTLNMKLSKGERVSVNDYPTTGPSPEDAEEAGLGVRYLRNSADEGGENLTGLQVLESDQHDNEFLNEFLIEKPEAEVLAGKAQLGNILLNESMPIGKVILDAIPAINKSLPKYDQIETHAPKIRHILYDRGDDRREMKLLPVVISPNVMVFEYQKTKSTILLVSDGKEWTSRYFQKGEGEIPQQITKWLENAGQE